MKEGKAEPKGNKKAEGQDGNQKDENEVVEKEKSKFYLKTYLKYKFGM